MTYYFNTHIQKQADAAYEEGNFKEALQYYESAIGLLNQRRSSREHIFEHHFNYAYAYVLSEILYTRHVLISLAIEDGDPFEEQLNIMQGQYKELKLLLTNPLAPESKLAIEERCNDLKKKIGKIYEKLSDYSYDKHSQRQELLPLLKAIEYMENALTYYQPDFKIKHLYGYFNLLEQAFLDTKEPAYLHKMQQYLPAINDMEHLTAAQRIEGYSYWYLLKSNHADSKQDLAFIQYQINRCYESLSEEEKLNEELIKCWREINNHHRTEEETLVSRLEKDNESGIMASVELTATEKKETETEPNEDISISKKRKIENTQKVPVKKRNKPDIERPRAVTFFASTTIVYENDEQETFALNAQKFINFIHQVQKAPGKMDATFLANVLLVISDALTQIPQSLVPKKLCVPLIQYTLTLESMEFKETFRAKQELIKLENNRWVQDNRHFVSRTLQQKNPLKEELIRSLENFVNEISTYQQDTQSLNHFFHFLMSEVIEIFEKHALFGPNTAQYIDKLRKYVNEQMIEPSASSIVNSTSI